ncbi:hypothetical protein HID58_005973 [Brassica napus]|uniref:Uncharacterized protein n=1 Tax=Brassica napus TaxID=3708 RepID=A0ABQ8EAU6_BRANA|nr:hypothetical protein HID58_005973 [Brassica napus]
MSSSTPSLNGFSSPPSLSTAFSPFYQTNTLDSSITTLPCLLCTRIEHVLVPRDSHFYYNDSKICDSHKKKVSSLAYCHVHKKLSKIKHMCEGCLLSFATQKEYDCDTYNFERTTLLSLLLLLLLLLLLGFHTTKFLKKNLSLKGLDVDRTPSFVRGDVLDVSEGEAILVQISQNLHMLRCFVAMPSES